MPSFWTKDSHPSGAALQPALANDPTLTPINLQSDSDASDKERAENPPSLTHINLQSDSDASDKERAENSPSHGVNSGEGPLDNNVLVSDESRNGAVVSNSKSREFVNNFVEMVAKPFATQSEANGVQTRDF
ncbi:hypothetical protein CK203_096977 [Vitis vinifera]|nr:hypothetical protein CK203_096977 [Vitis vinifera]